jgi:hypothetical protein
MVKIILLFLVTSLIPQHSLTVLLLPSIAVLCYRFYDILCFHLLPLAMLSRDSLLHFFLFLMIDYNQIIVYLSIYLSFSFLGTFSKLPIESYYQRTNIMNANFEYCEYYVIAPSTAICANEYQSLDHCLCKMDLYIRTVMLAMLVAHARTKYSICFINNKL